MKSMNKLTPFVLGTVFSINAFAVGGAALPSNLTNNLAVSVSSTTAVSAVVATAPQFVAPTPLTNQVLLNKSTAQLLDHVLLNKISELLVLAELEGMQRDWFVNDEKINQLNQLTLLPNGFSQLKNEAGAITTKIIMSLNRGFVSPELIGEKTNIKTKKLSTTLVKAELTKYANGLITAADLFNMFRPKNANYQKLLSMYRKITTMKQNGEIMMTPSNLGIVKAGSLDRSSILFARQRLAMFGYENDVYNPEYTEDLNLAIQDLQENNLLKRDGVIGKNSWGLLNTPIDQIITRLKINLDRSRWLPDDLQSEYVHINLAAQRLFYYKDNMITLTFRTINGRVERPTPIMIDAINAMYLNPTWTVPPTIYFEDKGKVFTSDPGHALEYRYKVVEIATGLEVQVTDVNWAAETSKERFAAFKLDKVNNPMNYRIIQKPGGDKNALGWIKFPLIRNNLSIFMHDTNERYRFAQTNRMLSSGCIRMEKPFELAEKLLSNQIDFMTGLPIHTVDTLKAETELLFPLAEDQTLRQLGRTVPVYVLYETTQINDHGQMTLVADPYGVDMNMYNVMIGLPANGVIQPVISTATTTVSATTSTAAPAEVGTVAGLPVTPISN